MIQKPFELETAPATLTGHRQAVVHGKAGGSGLGHLRSESVNSGLGQRSLPSGFPVGQDLCGWLGWPGREIQSARFFRFISGALARPCITSICIALYCTALFSVFRIPPFDIPTRVRRVFRIPPSGFRIPLQHKNIALDNALAVSFLSNTDEAFFLQIGDYFRDTRRRQAEEFGERLVGFEAATSGIYAKALDLNQHNFLLQAQPSGQPKSSRNPNSLKCAFLAHQTPPLR